MLLRCFVTCLLLHGVTMATSDKKDLVSANTQFGLELYQRVAQLPSTENIFISPLSVHAALAMTSIGARYKTLEQMESVLHLGDVQDPHGEYRELSRLLFSGDDDAKLESANRLFGSATVNVKPAFQNAVSESYGADLVTKDFAGKSEEARGEINRWVEEQTHDKIKELLPSGSIGPTTALVLVNAIYFKGKWTKSFDPAKTAQATFYAGNDQEMIVDMMRAEGSFKHGYDPQLGVETLELPYDGDMSMFVILPSQSKRLSDIESKLSLEMLNTLVANDSMQKRTVVVSLPKFRLEESYKLNEALAQMGMEDLFSEPRCDLSGVNGGHNLYISAFYHKGFVDVNEEGTEAAAASAAVGNFRTSPPAFNANRPFLFFIRHNRSKSILFLGRLQKPN